MNITAKHPDSADQAIFDEDGIDFVILDAPINGAVLQKKDKQHREDREGIFIIIYQLFIFKKVISPSATPTSIFIS